MTATPPAALSAADEARILTVTVDGDGIAVLTFDMVDRPMNVMSPEARQAFAAATDRLLADDAVTGIVITSARPAFVAGADLRALVAFHRADPAFVKGRMSILRDQLRKLERAGKPVVAALPGTALGGGLEIALACHRRIAVAGPRTVFGLPEVGLGLLPGAGGTQRLPRLIGLKAALPLLLEGTRLSAEAAHAAGILDEIVPADALLDTAKAWLKTGPDPIQPWDRASFAMPGGAPDTPDNRSLLDAARETVRARTRGNYPAPETIMACVETGCAGPIDAGLAREFEGFVGLVTGDVAQNLIATGFFAMNDAAKLKTRPAAVPKAEIARIGILGAGTEAAALAELAVGRGLSVVLVDLAPGRAATAAKAIAASLDRSVEKGRLTADKRDAALAKLTATDDPAALSGVDAIVEAAGESAGEKRDALRRLSGIVGSDTLCLSVQTTGPMGDLPAAWGRPDRVVGLHPFDPVARAKPVEIVRGAESADAAVAQAMDLAKALGKIPIPVRDGPGFFADRLAVRFVEEGMAARRDGASAKAVEAAALAAGFPQGPLALADAMGRDRLRRIADGMADGPSPPIDPTDPDAAGGPVDIDPQALGRRFLHTVALEAARAFGAGTITDRGLADVASQLCLGFPAWTGGALRWIATVGPDRFAAECQALEAEHGPRFALPDGFARTIAE